MTDWMKDHVPDPRDTSFTEDLGKAEGAMTDDPRAILKAAGVECAEVREYDRQTAYLTGGKHKDAADAAILALARFVAKYKYERDLCSVDLCVVMGEPAIDDADDPRVGSSSAVVADLERRWEEHNA